MKNYESHPTGSVPFLKVNATSFNDRGRDFGCGRGHGRGHYNRNYSYNKNTGNHHKWVNNKEIQEKDGGQSKKNMKNIFY